MKKILLSILILLAVFLPVSTNAKTFYSPDGNVSVTPPDNWYQVPGRNIAGVNQLLIVQTNKDTAVGISRDDRVELPFNSMNEMSSDLKKVFIDAQINTHFRNFPNSKVKRIADNCSYLFHDPCLSIQIDTISNAKKREVYFDYFIKHNKLYTVFTIGLTGTKELSEAMMAWATISVN